MKYEPRFHSRKINGYLPDKFLLFCLIFLVYALIFSGISAEKNPHTTIPNYQLEDQFGNKISNKSLKGKKIIYAGCFPEDEEICRKIARKIYWKMQSLIYGKENQFYFVGYVILHNTNAKIAKSIIPKYKTSGYESVYLDWNGILEEGSRKGYVHIRGVDSGAQVIFEEYWKKADNQDVISLYNQLNE